MIDDEGARPVARGKPWGGDWNRCRRPGPPPGREHAGRFWPEARHEKRPAADPLLNAARAAGATTRRGVLRSEIAAHYSGSDLDAALAEAVAAGELLWIPEALGYRLGGGDA